MKFYRTPLRLRGNDGRLSSYESLSSFPRRRESRGNQWLTFLICTWGKIGCTVFFLLIAFPVFAITKIHNIRIWPSPDNTRIVLDLSTPIQYKLETDQDNTIILELQNAHLQIDPASLNLQGSRIKNIQVVQENHDNHANQENQKNPKKLKIKFDLTTKLKPNVFALTPNQQYGDRLVMDLEMDQSEREAILALFAEDAPVSEGKASQENTAHKSTAQEIPPQLLSENISDLQPVKTLAKKSHPFIVAIDPGHGGEDPGAVGKRGTKEKDVVLRIAKQLKILIDKEPNMRAVLTRTGDYYIALHERVRKARLCRADFFISIHADAFHDPRVEGASIFTLSEHGATSARARILAARENKSDLIGGVKLSDKNKVLASVLLDLSQTKSKEEGFKAAQYVLCSLGKIGKLHVGTVEQAGFAVLKAPDIPSCLVETGFISNYAGEAKLRNPEHQKKIAKALLEGIRRYAAGNAR